MNSSRNIFIVGFSIFSGLAIPNWVSKNSKLVETGIVQFDQVILVLLTTGMFVGGFFGFVLDNTIPGTKEERGILAWKQEHGDESDDILDSAEVYNLPFGIGAMYCTGSWIRYLPFCPKPKKQDSSRSSTRETSLDTITNREMETRH